MNRKERIEAVATALVGELRVGQRVKTKGGAFGVIIRKGSGGFYDWLVKLDHTGIDSLFLDNELKPA